MADHAIDLKTLQRRAGSHSIFAPSASAMWLNCSGSLVANLSYPDDASIDAAYGTVGHGVGEQWLKRGKPVHLLGEKETVDGFEITIDDEMMDYVEQYVDWCRSLPGDHYVEQKVYFSQLTPIPKQGGTADHAACNFRHLVITDLKLGIGVKVFAAQYIDDPRWGWVEDGHQVVNGNTQAMLYALGFIYEWDWLYGFERVTIRIAQPRLEHFETWETTVEELFAFAEYAKARAKLAWTADAARSPSPKACQWCRARKTCPALVAQIEAMADDTFEDQTLDRRQMEAVKTRLNDEPRRPRDPRSLTTAQLAYVVTWRRKIEVWFKDAHAELERRALADGEEVPGFKVVQGRSSYIWTDKDGAESILVDAGVDALDLYEMKFVSVAGARELLRRRGIKKKAAEKMLDEVIYKSPGRHTLVKIGDDRPALPDSADASFEDHGEL